MSEKTPKRRSFNELNQNFSPIILPISPAAASPQRNLTGPPRVARDIAADLYNNIQRWNDQHIKGAGLVKAIASLKADDPKAMSSELEKHVNELFQVVQNLTVFRKRFDGLSCQMKALSKVNNGNEPLFISLDGACLAKLVEDVASAYIDEFKVKEHILENISYARNADEAMFYAAAWTYQHFVSDKVNFKLETLLVETGHRKIV